MKYLLSQKEYDALAPKAALDEAIEAQVRLAQALAAKTMPTGRCTHVSEGRIVPYCDDCGAAWIGCPLTKRFSK